MSWLKRRLPPVVFEGAISFFEVSIIDRGLTLESGNNVFFVGANVKGKRLTFCHNFNI
jgi:hypothetical protein